MTFPLSLPLPTVGRLICLFIRPSTFSLLKNGFDWRTEGKSSRTQWSKIATWRIAEMEETGDLGVFLSWTRSYLSVLFVGLVFSCARCALCELPLHRVRSVCVGLSVPVFTSVTVFMLLWEIKRKQSRSASSAFRYTAEHCFSQLPLPLLCLCKQQINAAARQLKSAYTLHRKRP